MKDCFNSASELQFKVYATDCPTIWNEIKDFRLIWAKDWNKWFEISVETDEESGLSKSISATSLGEAELSQVNLYDIEINTETDINRDDYKPTVLYDSNHKECSLLDRITEKVPHYSIKHVDSTIANIQRTFSFNETSVLNAFQDISKEIDCLFVLNCYTNTEGELCREINVYDLKSYCLDCGERGTLITTADDPEPFCEKCKSHNVLTGYGKETPIFISAENLSDKITYHTDTGSVKNCFKLKAGDDLMTATIVNSNPNGSEYIWHITEDTKHDMSAELQEKINEYDQKYAYYQSEHKVELPAELVKKYNELLQKYSTDNQSYATLPKEIVGYPDLMKAYYEAIDFSLFLENTFMPPFTPITTTAAEEAAKLTHDSLSPVAVQNLQSASEATVTSAVLSMAKIIVNPNYKVKATNTSYSNGTWSGKFVVTSYADETDQATSTAISVTVNDNYENFVKQKIEKILNQKSTDVTDIVELFKLDEDNFKSELKRYCLTSLKSFYDCCQGCLDILIQQGVSDKGEWIGKENDLYTDIYIPYYNKSLFIQDEINVRSSEIAVVDGVYDKENSLVTEGIKTVIDKERMSIQNALNLKNFMGESFWCEMMLFRREDVYSNTNYISDGLTTAELFKNALEFISTAQEEIYKSANLQHSISANLKNLLLMKEFSPIIDYFEVGNWIRIRVDGRIYRLRLLDYSIDFDSPEDIDVNFSDVMNISTGMTDLASIQEQAKNMATSYSSVARQANKGDEGNRQISRWVEKGIALTQTKIVDDADNQNVTFDSHGLLGREYVPATDSYDAKQIKLINKGLYMTDDDWLTSRACIGNFMYYDPESGEVKESYGVIANTLIGNLILSEKVGVYNQSGSVKIGENGISIITKTLNGDAGKVVFEISKKSNNDTITPILSVNNNGDVELNGAVRINVNSDSAVKTINDLASKERIQDIIDETVEKQNERINNSIESRYTDAVSHADTILNSYKSDVGQYLKYDGEGLTLGSESNAFKTIIDNRGMYFKDGNTVTAYVSNKQLNIPVAAITSGLILGKYFFSPKSDGGFTITWH